MSKVLLREFFELRCDDRGCRDLLTEGEKRMVSEGHLIFPAKLQQCDVQNGNGRVYPRKVLEREMKNYQQLVDDRRALGECDHPDDSVINLKNASHIINRVWWDGDDVLGTIKVLNTPAGKILRGLYDGGVKFGFSSRALGSLKEGTNGSQVVQEDLQLICFDAVSEPSAPGAYIMESKGKINEAFQKQLNENFFTKSYRINRALNEILSGGK
ncbi:MAG TPA: primosomal protein [Balneola sp.]|nr:primosomal protein [Balneola sp.]